MNENAKAWIQALRSGEYTQTTGVLSNQDRHCCLGVACDLAVQAEVTEVRPAVGGVFEYGPEGGRCSAFLPVPVSDWLGISPKQYDRSSPAVAHAKSDMSLTFMNDKQRLTFGEIADVIEENAEVLFA